MGLVMKNKWCMVVFVGAYIVLNALANASESIRVDRYTTINAIPQKVELDPLSVVVTLKLPENIINVGGAVKYALKRSGYTLANEKSLDKVFLELAKKPIPHIHRTLSTMTLRNVLKVLAGESYVLVEDPVNRLVALDSVEFRTGNR